MTAKTKKILIGTVVAVAVIGAILYIKKRNDKAAVAKATAPKTAPAPATTTT